MNSVIFHFIGVIVMKKILVTGAWGLTGQYVTRALLTAGYHVVASDTYTKPNDRLYTNLYNSLPKRSKLEAHWTNLESETPFGQLSETKPFDAVIHLAFMIPPYSEESPSVSHNINVLGTKKLLDFTREHSPKARFVFASSTSVFGKQGGVETIVSLENVPNGTSNYTSQKIACEDMVKDSSLDWRVLRLSAIMNPKFRPDEKSRRFGMLINLNTHFEPVHILDVAEAFKNVLDLKSNDERLFIISGGRNNRVTYKQYVEKMMQALIGNITEKDIPWHKFSDKAYYLYWYDTDTSQKALCYQSRTIEDYIRDVHELTPWWKKVLFRLFKHALVNKYFSD